MTPRDCAPEFDPRTGRIHATDGNTGVQRQIDRENDERTGLIVDPLTTYSGSVILESWEGLGPLGAYTGDTGSFSIEDNPADATDHVAMHETTTEDCIVYDGPSLIIRQQMGYGGYRFDMRVAGLVDFLKVGLIFGAQDASNYYAALMQELKLCIYKVEGGGETLLDDSATPLGWATGTWYQFQLVWYSNGDMRFIWGGGDHVAQCNDTTFTAGTFGFRALAATSTPAAVKVYFGTLEKLQ